jgi:hypothetical protein
MRLLRTTLVTLFALLVAGSASALTLTWNSAFATATANSQGSALSLSVNPGVAAGTWAVRLGIDSTNYFGSLPGLNQVGFGAIKNWTGVTLDSFTAGSWGTPVGAVVNNSACTVGENHFKICVNGFTDVKAAAGLYEWNFTVTGGQVMVAEDWHLGGQYNSDQAGSVNGNIISTGAAPVPEPSAALVYALGLGAVSLGLRNRRRS